jgi:O-antigen/teichoic acid export membrane protein
LPALGVNITAGYVLGVRGQMQRVALAYTCALVVNVALNRWLIPGSGATGAAAARLVASFEESGSCCWWR